MVSDYFERNLSWPQAWNKFFQGKEDIANTFAAFATGTETPLFEPWLRGLLFLVLAHQISACSLDEVVALPAKLLLSIQETQKCIATFGDKHGCKQEALLHDLQMLTRLCEASTRVGTLSAGTAREVRDHICKESRMALIKTALDSDAGKELWHGLECVLERSAQDIIADQRMDQALATFDDKTMLRGNPTGEGERQIMNCSLVLTGKIAEVLTYTFAHAVEATRLWSAVRKDEQRALATAYSNHMDAVMTAVDEVLAAHMSIWIRKILELGQASTGDEFQASQLQLKELRGEAADLLETLDHDDKLDKFLTRYIAVETNSDAFIKALLQGRAVKVATQNLTRRRLFRKCCVCLLAFADDDVTFTETGPSPPGEVAASMDSNDGFLRCAINLKAALNAWADAGPLDFVDTDPTPWGTITMSGDVCVERDDLCIGPGALSDLSFVQAVLRTVMSSVGEAVLRFRDTLELPGVSTTIPSTAVPAAELHTVLASLVCAEHMPKTVAAAARSFLAKDPVLPACPAFTLLQSLFHACDIEMVSASRFMQGTTSDASISKNDAMSMFAMYVLLHETAGAVTFLQTLFLPSAPSNVENHVLSTDVIKALDFVGGKVAAATAACETAEQTPTLPWLLTVQQAKSWCAAVSIVLVQIKRAAFAQCVADVNDLAEQLVKHTPKFGHCVNDATYVKTLAKRHLLECPTRDKLSTETVEFVEIYAAVAAIAPAHGLGSPTAPPRGRPQSGKSALSPKQFQRQSWDLRQSEAPMRNTRYPPAWLGCRLWDPGDQRFCRGVWWKYWCCCPGLC